MISTTDDLIITDPLLCSYRDRIAELRQQKHDLIAGIMRDELLCQIEQFLDPNGIAQRDELRAIQCREAVALALDVDPDCGF